MNFKTGLWENEINVQNFINTNYTAYEGDEKFLSPISNKTQILLDRIIDLQKIELEKGVLDIETTKISSVAGFDAGYIDKDNEVIVGLQTDKPLKRIVNPFGGKRMAETSLEAFGYKLEPNLSSFIDKYLTTHNDGVFAAYTDEMRAARKTGLLTGLPDAYGRGRIIGDYRRVALYGVDRLITEKIKDKNALDVEMTDENIRKCEEITKQIASLKDLKTMALSYGIDISMPATNAKEAVQFLYFAYLAGTKENNGAATSLGRTSTFLDIYIENDIKQGLITEEEAQELIDQFVLKLRIIRHLRTPEYDELFAGDPTWITEAIGGTTEDGKSLVTKTSFRMLHTLINLGSSPEPNLTVLWSENLPESFKKYCSYISIETASIQYENDDIMRPIYGDDYGIACCVSAMKLGKQMQFFGARCNLPKALLYSLNGGVDEVKNIKVLDGIEKYEGEYLDYDKVMKTFNSTLEKLMLMYTKTMNIIHYMHDKYAYESVQLALHDTEVEHLMAFGAAGLSVAADSLSAIKYAKVKVIRNETGLITDFEIEGEFPKFGNDIDEVDTIASELASTVSTLLNKHKLYKDAKATLSILTITSNVVYGKKTGNTPDGRKYGEPFAPGANPLHGRDMSGALASLNSVSKICYDKCCLDGVSNTFSIIPNALGNNDIQQKDNLVNIIDGYFATKGHHLNVNVMNREMLVDAMENPEKYPTLTIRVSGYAVRFNRLTPEQQKEVISRTFHEKR